MFQNFAYNVVFRTKMLYFVARKNTLFYHDHDHDHDPDPDPDPDADHDHDHEKTAPALNRWGGGVPPRQKPLHHSDHSRVEWWW